MHALHAAEMSIELTIQSDPNPGKHPKTVIFFDRANLTPQRYFQTSQLPDISGRIYWGKKEAITPKLEDLTPKDEFGA